MNDVLSRSDLTDEALYLEYTSAVKPPLPPVPIELYKSRLHRAGPKGESLTSQSNASAQLYYVIRGRGTSKTEFGPIEWQEGDVFVLPMSGPIEHSALEDTALYHVNDAPLVDYLGARPVTRMFEPVLYPADTIMSELKKVSEEPQAPHRNRDAIILGDKAMYQIKSATHTLWAAIVWMNPDEVQRPHRHNSIAVDIIIEAEPGAYTLLGSAVDDEGNIVNPQRVDWESGAAFVTPPHLWHGHYNESHKPAKVMAVQDAGFYEHLRTLNITFTGPRSTGVEYKS